MSTAFSGVDEESEAQTQEGGYTPEQVENGDFPSLMSLLPADLAAEVSSMVDIHGRPFYQPMSSAQRGRAA